MEFLINISQIHNKYYAEGGDNNNEEFQSYISKEDFDTIFSIMLKISPQHNIELAKKIGVEILFKKSKDEKYVAKVMLNGDNRYNEEEISKEDFNSLLILYSKFLGTVGDN